MATREKEKAALHAQNKDRRPRASLKYIHMSARKAKTVVDLVRGKSVAEALAILMYTPKAATGVVSKLIQSAAANAEHNLQMDPASLYVAEICANQGPTMKRGIPRARGRMDIMKRRSCHITVVLDSRK